MSDKAQSVITARHSPWRSLLVAVLAKKLLALRDCRLRPSRFELFEACGQGRVLRPLFVVLLRHRRL